MERSKQRVARREWTWPVIVAAVWLIQCGGRVIADDGEQMARSDSGGALPTNAGTAGDDCVPASCAGSANGGTGGNDCVILVPCGGEHNLEPYARLRTACSLDTTVHRGGASTSICHHIK